MRLPVFGALVTLSFVLSLFGCALVRGVAARLRLVDVPNERSLHKAPVPRLGGVALVVSVWAVLAVAALVTPIFEQHRDFVPWLATASAIAVLGFIDDVRPLSALPRLLTQVGGAAIVTLCVLHGGTAIELAGGLHPELALAVVAVPAVLFVVGTTNIFNFMDGMDGLAASQTLAAGTALGVACLSARQPDLAFVAFAMAAASAGFFVHNSPPASIFLGDAGSTFVGFSFAVLALVASTRAPAVPLVVVPLALAPFLLDGTFTIFRRLLAGERIWKAHRTHLYQRAVGSGLTHREVLVVYAAWCAAGAAAALIAARSDLAGTAGAAIAMLASLLAVRRWVVRLESRATSPSD